MSRALLLVAVILLAGCATPAAQQTLVRPSVPDCFRQARPQSQEGQVGPVASYIITPTGGYMRNGGVLYFPWSSDPEGLVAVDLQMEWETGAGGQDLLRLEVERSDTPRSHYAEGPSPLRMHVAEALQGLDELTVIYGTAGNVTPVGSVAVVDQTVLVTVVETYRC